MLNDNDYTLKDYIVICLFDLAVLLAARFISYYTGHDAEIFQDERQKLSFCIAIVVAFIPGLQIGLAIPCAIGLFIGSVYFIGQGLLEIFF